MTNAGLLVELPIIKIPGVGHILALRCCTWNNLLTLTIKFVSKLPRSIYAPHAWHVLISRTWGRERLTGLCYGLALMADQKGSVYSYIDIPIRPGMGLDTRYIGIFGARILTWGQFQTARKIERKFMFWRMSSMSTFSGLVSYLWM